MASAIDYLPIISAVAICAARLAEIGTKRDTLRGAVKEHLTLLLFVLVGMFMVVGSIIEYWLRGHTISWPLFIAGWACAIASFAIRRSAIAALGKFWSLHVEIRDSHQFVQNGPFRFVRHPTYFSMILELLSMALLLNALWMTLVIPLLFFPVLIARIRMEEAALIEKFGDAYKKYQQTVPALLPLGRKSP